MNFLLSQTQIHLTDVYSHNSIAIKEKERKQTSLLMREYVMFEMILFEEERNQFIGYVCKC